MLAETYLLQVLQSGISSIRSNPSQLDLIMNALNERELNAAKTWFSNPQNEITIAPGFPMEVAHLPFIGVTIADESQKIEETGVGLAYYSYTNSAGHNVNVRGARFSGTLKGTIYTPDANILVWISAVCRWSLLKHYDWLGEMGFNNISIGQGDFEPAPQFLPVFTFARGIFLRADYDAIFEDESPSAPITGAVITGEFKEWGG